MTMTQTDSLHALAARLAAEQADVWRQIKPLVYDADTEPTAEDDADYARLWKRYQVLGLNLGAVHRVIAILTTEAEAEAEAEVEVEVDTQEGEPSRS